MAQSNGYKYDFNIIYSYKPTCASNVGKFVEHLVDYLEASDHCGIVLKGYYAHRDLLPGKNLFNENFSVLKQSRFTIVVLDETFFQDEWSKYWNHACFKTLIESGPEGEERFIPIAYNMKQQQIKENNESIVAKAVLYFSTCYHTQVSELDKLKQVLRQELRLESLAKLNSYSCGPHLQVENPTGSSESSSVCKSIHIDPSTAIPLQVDTAITEDVTRRTVYVDPRCAQTLQHQKDFVPDLFSSHKAFRTRLEPEESVDYDSTKKPTEQDENDICSSVDSAGNALKANNDLIKGKEIPVPVFDYEVSIKEDTSFGLCNGKDGIYSGGEILLHHYPVITYPASTVQSSSSAAYEPNKNPEQLFASTQVQSTSSVAIEPSKDQDQLIASTQEYQSENRSITSIGGIIVNSIQSIRQFGTSVTISLSDFVYNLSG